MQVDTVERRRPDDEEVAWAVAVQHPHLVRLAFLLAGDRDRADEAVALAVERALGKARTGEIRDLPAYLRAAVVNEVRSGGRRDGARRRREERYVAATGPVAALDEGAARRADVRAALDALPTRQRAVVVLRYFADLTEAQTAAALGVRVGTVKSQAAKALLRLRPLLSDPEEMR